VNPILVNEMAYAKNYRRRDPERYLPMTDSPLTGAIADAVAACKLGDYETACRISRSLAEQGLCDAQIFLAIMYDKGQGVPQDFVEAAKLYRKAADQGDADAQYALGDMYGEGKGVPQNYVRAYTWYNLAASQYASSPHYELYERDRESAEILRDLLARKMTPAQIAETQRLAREWKPKKEK
jgi:TPR repeat protein